MRADSEIRHNSVHAVYSEILEYRRYINEIVVNNRHSAVIFKTLLQIRDSFGVLVDRNDPARRQSFGNCGAMSSAACGAINVNPVRVNIESVYRFIE